MAAGTAFVMAFADDGRQPEEHKSDNPIGREKEDDSGNHEHQLEPASVAAGHATREVGAIGLSQRFQFIEHAKGRQRSIVRRCDQALARLLLCWVSEHTHQRSFWYRWMQKSRTGLAADAA